MVRLKFVLFALVALALLLGQLFVLTPPVSGRGEALALEAARSAAAAARGEVSAQRAQLLEAALAVRALPEAQQALGTARGGASEKLAPLAAAAREALPQALREKVVLGLGTQETLVLARGGEAPVDAPAALDGAALSGAGVDGVLVELYSAPHLAVSVPGAGASALVVALPLEAPGLAALAPPGGTLGVALWAGGKAVAVAGATPAAPTLAALVQKLKPGSAEVVERGGTQSLGPLRLPLLTRSGDTSGGAAPLLAGARREVLPGLEAVALVSTEPMMAALAGSQRLALFACAALLVLAGVWTVLMGSGARAAAAQQEEEGLAPQAPEEQGTANVLPLPEAAPAAEAGAEDFRFGAVAAASGHAALEQPEPQYAAAPAYGTAEPAWSERGYEAGPAHGSAEPAYAEPAYPAPAYSEPAYAGDFAQASPAPAAWAPPEPPAAADPFAMVAPPSDSGYGSYEDNPDATRVATVPDELLRASASASATSVRPAGWAQPSRPLQAVPQVAPPAVDPEEQHFRDVYQEFVATRERCGEAADGLTYEKFALKLRKNREQLVAKYACRSVRFQVYVKEGKAALKATPIKD